MVTRPLRLRGVTCETTCTLCECIGLFHFYEQTPIIEEWLVKFAPLELIKWCYPPSRKLYYLPPRAIFEGEDAPQSAP